VIGIHLTQFVTHTTQHNKGYHQTHLRLKRLTPDGVICYPTDLKFAEQMAHGTHPAAHTSTWRSQHRRLRIL
jgi:hypothetical protein